MIGTNVTKNILILFSGEFEIQLKKGSLLQNSKPHLRRKYSRLLRNRDMFRQRPQNKNILQISSVAPKSINDDIAKIEQSAVSMVPHIKVIEATQQKMPASDLLTLQEQSRKPLTWPLMILNILVVLASCFQNGYLIYAPESHTNEIGIVFGLIMVIDIITCIGTSCYLVSSKWEMMQLYLLIDNILLVAVAASIGFVSFNDFRSQNTWYFDLVTIAFPLDFFLLVGNFRVLMVKGEWSKWKIILYKCTLLICCIMFFEIGVYFITVDYSYTNGLDSTFDGQVKQLMLLNVFGTFSLIIEMYSKMTDLDHTGQLQSTYELKQFNDNQLANNLLEYSQLLKIREQAEQKGLLAKE